MIRVRQGFVLPLVCLLWGMIPAALARSSAPEVFSLPAERLAEARREAGLGAEFLGPALEQLLAEAEDALGRKPASVMDKTSVAASGDKHDYYSMAPYWWPDPAKPDGRPYVWKDGYTNPESVEGTDRRAFARTCRDIWTLALAHHLTGRAAFAEHAALITRVWFLDPATRMNPHLEYGQAIPGTNDGRPTGVIETGVLINVTEGVSLLAGSPAWTSEDDAAFKVWIGAYLEWLLNSSHGRIEREQRNNHGTWYDAQVVQFQLFLGRLDEARDYLATAGPRRFSEQIAEDGSQPHELTRTTSLPYSIYNLQGLVILAAQAKRVGADWWSDNESGASPLRRAVTYLEPYADPSVPWIKGLPKTWGHRRELRELMALAFDSLSTEQKNTLVGLMSREPFHRERARLFLPAAPTAPAD